jgi:thiamine kinase-like enzyme
MNNQQLAHLCERFQLGTAPGEAQPVTGGLIHRMWRVETSLGVFAVKQLNPEIISQPGLHDRYRQTEQIATAMAAQGVPAVPALARADGPVQDIDDITVLVYPWREGSILPPGPADPAQGELIGAALARMHALRLDIAGLEIPTWRVFRDDDWVLLARRADEQTLPWAERLREMLRDIRWWNRLAQEADKRLWNTLVVSHRDLDQKNVLWQEQDQFAIVDWESAGLTNPTRELADAALAWSGQTVGEASEVAFRAVIDGYRKAGGAPLDSAYDAMHSCLGNWLEWLEYNLGRSLNAALSPEEQAIANAEIPKTLTTLQTLAENLGQYVAWMEIA